MDPFLLQRLARVLRQLKPARTFLLDTFFGETDPFGTTSVRVDIDNRKRRMAPFSSARSKGTQVEKRGYISRTYTPPYVKPFVDYTPEDLAQRFPGEVIQQDDSTQMQRLVNRDLQDLNDMYTRREEWMAMQGLVNHQIPIVGEGYNETIDLLFDASHTVTLAGADLWTAGTADPYGDIEGIRRQIAQDSGLTCDVGILGADVWDALRLNDSFRAQLDTRRVELGQFMPRELPDGVSYIGDLKSQAISLFTYDEWFVDPVDDTEKALFPVNKALFGASRARAVRNYAAIQDFDASGNGSLRRARNFPKTWLENNPSVRYLMVQGSPMPTPVQVQGFVTLNPI